MTGRPIDSGYDASGTRIQRSCGRSRTGISSTRTAPSVNSSTIGARSRGIHAGGEHNPAGLPFAAMQVTIDGAIPHAVANAMRRPTP